MRWDDDGLRQVIFLGVRVLENTDVLSVSRGASVTLCLVVLPQVNLLPPWLQRVPCLADLHLTLCGVSVMFDTIHVTEGDTPQSIFAQITANQRIVTFLNQA